MYTAFSPGTKNLFLVLSAACCIVAFFFDGCYAEGTEAQKMGLWDIAVYSGCDSCGRVS